MTLSVVIITKNEEANLARTLPSVAWADEIVVVDSGSIDRTREIAETFRAKFFVEEWKGFAAQKNSALQKASGDWVLSLDADEEVEPALAEEIQSTLRSNPSVAGFWIPRKNFFLARWIRHGGFYPDPKLRLFRRGAGKFEDRLVHEDIQVTGPTAKLQNNLLHHAYPTLESYLEHMNRYSSLGAEMMVTRVVRERTEAKAAREATISPQVARSLDQVNEEIKRMRPEPEGLVAFSFRNILVRPGLTFFYNYVFRGGFLDGREGLLLHLYHANYVSWKYAKAWERGRSQHS